MGTRETVLVVDDEDMVRGLAVRMLARRGYRVLEAPGSEEALRVLQRASQEISGVLTDVVMPGRSGWQLGEIIARHWPGVRVLYMSGFPLRRMVGEEPFDPLLPFIEKPFTSEQLARKMGEVLAGRRRH
ncbi:MAG: response regulator [Gemmatimonadales bacterium]